MSELKLSAGATTKKALHLAQDQMLILFCFYAVLVPFNAGLSLIPIVGTVASQFISTVVTLGLFLQLRKVLLGESKKIEPREVLLPFQDSKFLMKIVTYMFFAAIFFVPVAILYGILYTLGAFQGVQGQSANLNPSFLFPVLIVTAVSGLYAFFFVFPSILFALDLHIVKAMSLKDAFSESLNAVYRHFWYMARVGLLQMLPILLGGIIFALLSILFKENSNQMIVLEVGLYILVLIPTFIYLAGVRAALFVELFDSTSTT